MKKMFLASLIYKPEIEEVQVVAETAKTITFMQKRYYGDGFVSHKIYKNHKHQHLLESHMDAILWLKEQIELRRLEAEVAWNRENQVFKDRLEQVNRLESQK